MDLLVALCFLGLLIQAKLDNQLNLRSDKGNEEREFLRKNLSMEGHICRKCFLWSFDRSKVSLEPFLLAPIYNSGGSKTLEDV